MTGGQKNKNKKGDFPHQYPLLSHQLCPLGQLTGGERGTRGGGTEGRLLLSRQTNKLATFNTSWSLILCYCWRWRQRSAPIQLAEVGSWCWNYVSLFSIEMFLCASRPLCGYSRRQGWIMVMLIWELYIHQTIRGRLSGVTANAYDSQASVTAEHFCIVKHFPNARL